MSETPEVASLEKPEDAGKGKEGIVRRWLMELEIAGKLEKDWRKSAENTLKRYRSEGETGKAKHFNILWANTEVLRPSLYTNPPRPDVRKRNPDKDAVGDVASEVLERALVYSMDAYDFDHLAQLAVLDYVLPGRAVSRVKFVPYYTKTIDEVGQEVENLSYAEVICEHWPYDQFRHGAGSTWEEVPWVGFEHKLTRAELEDKFGELGKKVNLDCTVKGGNENSSEEDEDVFKRGVVWEILDKDAKKAIFIAPSYKVEPLLEEDRPNGLKGFFDCPRPLYAIESTDSLVPVCEYELYKDQAEELDRVTQRINGLIKGLKLRGIYDSTLKEMSQLMDAGDNDFIPATSAVNIMQVGGLDKAIWIMPIVEIAQVLVQLYQYREQLKVTIYEMTGLSDILRGSSDPNETLGAQQLKVQTGGLRVQRRQREVQRYLRDILRLKAELIAENFTPEILEIMTGIKLPRMQQKQEAQMIIQMAQQNGQQPPPDAQKLLTTPSWEEVMQVLKNDLDRNYKIDIETDSTIAANQQQDQENITKLLTGISNFIVEMGGAVQSGFIPMPAAKAMLMSAVRRFKMGREVEDALDDAGDEPMPQRPDPEMEKAKAQIQIEQQKAQADMQLKQAEAQQKAQLEQQKLQSELELAKMKFALEREIALMKAQTDMAVAGQKLAIGNEIKTQKAKNDMRANGASNI